MSNNGKLIVFSAPSGSGKTTLVHHLLNQTLPLGFSISATSRSPRGKERDGIDYHFLTTKDFKKKIKKGEFWNSRRFITIYITEHLFRS